MRLGLGLVLLAAGCSVVVSDDFTSGCQDGCPCDAVCEGRCECPSGCSCNLGCSDGDCTPRCANNSVCVLIGQGSDVIDASCENGAYCHLICQDSALCTLDCRVGSCLVECQGSQDCELRNCDAPMMCDSAVAVCRRECP